jgi:hypothetical protein
MAKRGVAVVTVARRGDKWIIDTDLNTGELRAIGLVTVQWAHLEHSVLVHSVLIAQQIDEPIDGDAASLSFSRRLAEFRRLASSSKLPATDSRRYIKICDRIANLESQRHKVAHALWEWDTDEPTTLAARSFRPRARFDVPIKVERIEKLAEKIGELLFDMDFPDGPDFENVAISVPRASKRAPA